MNKLTQVFNFEQNEVRVVVIDEETFFVGKDIAEILGYKKPNNALRDHVEDCDRKTLAYKAYPDLGTSLWSGNDFSSKTVINEPGLYSLIFNSELPNAKKFKRWVTSEVLPSIRKHGAYATPETIENIIANPENGIKLLTALQESQTRALAAEQQVNELQPKANYFDTIMKNKSITAISFIAKNYGMSAQKMNSLLHELGIQYKQGNSWLLYAKHQREGYTHIEYVPVQGSDNLKPIMKWTQKGHLFIYNEL
ncbi:MAG: phage antirepressor, partial [Enterococcus sp.]